MAVATSAARADVDGPQLVHLCRLLWFVHLRSKRKVYRPFGDNKSVDRPVLTRCSGVMEAFGVGESKAALGLSLYVLGCKLGSLGHYSAQELIRFRPSQMAMAHYFSGILPALVFFLIPLTNIFPVLCPRYPISAEISHILYRSPSLSFYLCHWPWSTITRGCWCFASWSGSWVPPVWQLEERPCKTWYAYLQSERSPVY